MNDTTRGFAAYTLESIFMQGADGITYRAQHAATGAKVLITVPHMPEEWEEIAPFRDRFLAAARQVTPLHHPGILDIREVGVDESSGMPFIAYESVDGRNLRELTAHGRRVADVDIATVGAGVADALEHAHAAGFVHGSVAPDNILFGEGGVKLCGFGVLSAAQSPTEMRGHAPGTGSYSSPEQIIGGTVDGRSDLFALGIILFELVTGQHPFLASPPRDARDRIVADEAPLPGKIRPDAPAAFNSLLFRLLQKDPAKRPAHAAEVAQTLRALQSRLLQPAPAPAAPVAAVRPAPAPRGGGLSAVHLAVGAGILVLVGAIAAVVLMRSPRPAAPVETAPTAAAESHELSAALDAAEAALSAGDFARAERLLVEARRLDPVNPRGLDIAQRARSMRDEKVKRLYDDGIAFGRAQRWQDAERRFNEVLALDPDNVDAKDQLEALHEVADARRRQQAAPSSAASPPVVARPAATPEPPRRLRVYFASPLPVGSLEIALDRRTFAILPFDFTAAGGSGVVQRTFDMPFGRHQVLATLHNQQGLVLGDQAFVLNFEPGHEFLLTVEMSGPRAVPRFRTAETTR